MRAPPRLLQPHSIDLNPSPTPLLISVSVVIFQGGFTALHYAASNDLCGVECLKALLDKGSDVNAADKVCDECDEQ